MGTTAETAKTPSDSTALQETKTAGGRLAEAEKLRIVYVPDAHKFILDEFLIYIRRPINDPEIELLRGNYQKLKEQTSLPEKVGVVTYPDVIKSASKANLTQLEQNCEIKVKTTHLPLEILERVLSIKDELEKDPDNLLMQQYAFREISALLGAESTLFDDKGVSSKHKWILHMASSIPSAKLTVQTLSKLSDALKQEGRPEEFDIVDKLAYELLQSFPSWEDLRQLQEFMKKRFATNKVSREFPLHFEPQGRFTPMLYEVSLWLKEQKWLKDTTSFWKCLGVVIKQKA
jgi:hypothetical protein